MGATWALLLPPWGTPDEDVHFSYTQTLAERHELPGRGPMQVSSEQRLSMNASNTDQVIFFQDAKPDWSPFAERVWRSATESARRDDGGAGNTASSYPPAYYLYEVLPYELASSTDVLTRMYVMRLFSALWLLVTTVGAWLLAGELFGRNRQLQLLTAATIGLWPMLTFMSSAINPDGRLGAMYTLGTWLGGWFLPGGLTPGRAA